MLRPALQPRDSHLGEFWGETHLARVIVASSPGGIALSQKHAEFGARLYCSWRGATLYFDTLPYRLQY